MLPPLEVTSSPPPEVPVPELVEPDEPEPPSVEPDDPEDPDPLSVEPEPELVLWPPSEVLEPAELVLEDRPSPELPEPPELGLDDRPSPEPRCEEPPTRPVPATARRSPLPRAPRRPRARPPSLTLFPSVTCAEGASDALRERTE